jgi:putative membrane protein
MQHRTFSLAHEASARAGDPAAWLLPVLLVAVPVLLYLAGVRRARRRPSPRGSRWHTGSFLTGAAMLGLATSPPLEALADADARGHMAQHLLLGMYAPLALVLGAPLTLLLGSIPVAARRHVGRVLGSGVLHGLGHPVSAALLSVGGLYLLYLTPLYVLTTQHTTIHHLIHLHFIVAGYLFAWSIAGPDPAPRRPGISRRAAVLVLAAAAHAYLAKLLFAEGDQLPPGSPHTVAEMEQAAQWMYYGGDIAEILLATALFAFWYRQRGRRQPRRSHAHPTAV